MRLFEDALANILAQAGISPWIAGLPRALIPASIGLIVLVFLVAGAGTARILLRMRRRQNEPDAGVRLRGAVYFATACIYANVFFWSTAEDFSGPFRVRFAILGTISATFAYAGYALWSVWLPRLRRRVPGSLRRGLDVLAMNAVLLLVLAEVALQGAAQFSHSPLLVTDRTPTAVRRTGGRQAPGSWHYNFPMNSGGHYDGEFVPRSASSRQIVISIGDSFSYGTVPHAYHFTTVAERESPGVEFYNMGYPRLGPSDYLDLMQREAIPLKPDLIVIQLFIGNDLAERPAFPAGPPAWHDADRYLLAIVWHRLQIMKRAKPAGRATTTEQPRMSVEQLATLYPWLTDPFLEKEGFTKDVHVDIELRNAQSVCLDDEATASSYQQLFTTIAAMDQVADSARVRLALVLIPGEFQVDDTLWNAIMQKSKQPMDRDRPQRLIRNWMAPRGRPVLDLLPILRAVPPLKDGHAHLYHLQETHFNARGNAVAGRALAHFADSLLSSRRPKSG